jgi:hypothetical protein
MLDYSLKYKVSLSTLRRRIKSQLIEYKMESGRYLIGESETATNVVVSGSSSLETSQMLIQELKRAYGTILSEKEEMIAQLKNEIEDLKKIQTLLEKEIERVSPIQTRSKDLLDQ